MSSESGYSEAAQKRTLKLIERKLNKRLRRRFIAQTLPHTLHVVTAALLLFFIGLTTAVATVRPVRLRIMDFIAKIEENYAAVGMTFNDNDDSIIPKEWEGRYYPFYIPEDYGFSHIDSFSNSVYYVAPNDCVLQYSEYEDANYTNVDIDAEDAFDITINGHPGIAMMSEEGSTIAWCVDNMCLYLYFSGEFDEANRIAASVR